MTTDPLPSLPELLPCPFCGGAATMAPMFAGRMQILRPDAVEIQCSNHGCRVQPMTDGYERAHAIAAWNTRAQGGAVGPVAWMLYGTTEDGSIGLVHFTQNPDDVTALHVPLFLHSDAEAITLARCPECDAPTSLLGQLHPAPRDADGLDANLLEACRELGPWMCAAEDDEGACVELRTAAHNFIEALHLALETSPTAAAAAIAAKESK